MKDTYFRVGPTDRLIRALAHTSVIRRKAPQFASYFSHPDRTLRKAFVVDYHGFKYRGELPNRIDWSIYFVSNFLDLEVDLIKRSAETMRRIRSRFVCYDIGANIGHLTLAMASIADQVVAFEPSPYALARLRDNVSANHVNHVQCLNVGLGKENATTAYDILSPINFKAKRKGRPSLDRTFGKFDAFIKRGDELVCERKLPPPDFVRVNADDDGLDVLKGLKETISASNPIVLIDRPHDYRAELYKPELLAALYPDVDLYTLSGCTDDPGMELTRFTSLAQQIIGLPSFMSRMAQQEQAKRRSLKLASSP